MKNVFNFKTLFAAVFLTTTAAGTYAQNAFFTAKAGAILTYAENSADGKANGYSRLTIKEVQGSGKNMTITYIAESLDKNRKPFKPPVEIPCKVIIKDNVMTLDMKQMFVSQMKDQSVKMDVTGIPVELPNNLQPGQTIKDAEMTMTIDMGIMKIDTVTKMTEGKCLAIEDVTVPAGTFKCHKITQTITTTAAGMKKVTSKVISWYAPGIGTVKTETYDDKGKLFGSTVLVELTGN
jgi:hypothetical protein